MTSPIPFRSLARLLGALAAALVLSACGGEDSDAPADHTDVKNGVPHKPGASSATTNCVACHGSNLRGGEGPSCYSCHGQRWN
jgi:mono/diheme cytochrome c family protein